MINILLLTFAFVIMTLSNAYAYLDPGTGSVILQVVAAAALGLILTFKTFWGKITGLFHKKRNKGENEKS